MGQIAWSSFSHAMRYKEWLWSGAITNGKRYGFHPCEMPIGLYKWLLQNYAKKGDKILDTHLGSGSSRIAAYEMGFDFWGYEIDKDYFDAQNKRFKEYKQQIKINFDETLKIEHKQLSFIDKNH